MEPAPVRFGLLGGRSWIFGAAVGPAIESSASATLVAVGTQGGEPPTALAPLDRGGYEDVLAADDVDAVYVPLANGLHLDWACRAAAAGKHVLCEKPLGRDAAETATILAAGDDHGVLIAEAWMTPFDRRWRQAINLAANGGLGDIVHVDAHFNFTIDPDNGNYRWRADQGGGSLLDVGIYCLGPIVALLGADPVSLTATAIMTEVDPGPVDARTDAELDFGEGVTARLSTSFQDPERQSLEIVGTRGRLILETDAHTGGPHATEIVLVDASDDRQVLTTDGGAPYLGMIDAFASAVRGRAPWPRPASEVLELARLLDRVRDATASTS